MNKDEQDFEDRTTATIAEAFETMVTASGVVHRNSTFLNKVVRSFYVRALRPMAYIVTVIVVILILQQLSLINRDNKIDDLTEQVEILDSDVKIMQKAADEAKTASDEAKVASSEAKIASEAAKTALDEAIAQSQRGGQSPETVEAFRRLNEVYTVCVVRKEC